MSRSPRYRFLTVDARSRGPFADGIEALASGASYPLGEDRFTIDAGADPFAFFDRLGTSVFDLILLEDRVVGLSVRVLRRSPRRCWYLCGLKVDPEHRGRRLTGRLARAKFLPAYLRSPRGYAISMDSPEQVENRIHRLSRKVLPVPMRATGLAIYSVDAGTMRQLEPTLRTHRGELGYLSLRGIKDIVLASTGRPIPLFHVQFGATAENGGTQPVDGATHMFCTPIDDPLHRALERLGIPTESTATCLHHRMGRDLLPSILTSEI